jgi:membrane carboxypeptidase/penicillin-binding protein PbpC
MIESYTHAKKKWNPSWTIGMSGIKKRVDRARELGMIDRTICWLGTILAEDEYHEASGVLTAERVEKQVAELRRHAPEMPGMIFYSNSNPELAAACDRILEKHFVAPAPSVHFTQPHVEQALTDDVVVLKVEAEGRDGRAIRKYRWFIDNRLVAETDEPTYKWDITAEWPGRHMLTVHAIDEDWNRAAAQVPVKIRY